MPSMEVGLSSKDEMILGRSHLASTMGNIGAEVLSTDRGVLLMELAP